MAIKASDNFKIYQNPNGPSIGTLTRKVIEKDGLYFKPYLFFSQYMLYNFNNSFTFLY